MKHEMSLNGTNVIAFEPRQSVASFWTVAAFQGVTAPGNIANENYAPAHCEGAQTSDMVLEFLQNVTMQA